MTRNITITTEIVSGESVKTVCVDIDGKIIRECYTYPSATADNTIQTEVNSDLDDKGYPS